jgi:cytochrome c55X
MKSRDDVQLSVRSPGCSSKSNANAALKKQSRKKVALVGSACSLIFSGMLFAQTIDGDRQQELDHLIKQDCGSCHGMTLKGGLGPALTKEALDGKPKQSLFDTIFYGREALAMPPWKGLLSEEEIWWIVDQLKNGDSEE